MTPFSIILCTMVLIILLREKKAHNVFVLLLAITMSIQVCSIGGYFIKIGSVEIDYVDVTLLLTAMFGFIASKNKVNRKALTLSSFGDVAPSCHLFEREVAR